MTFHLAQLNVGRLHHPLDHEASAEFERALDPINALAESSPGFVWRLTDDDGQSSSYVRLPGEDDPLLIVNFSIWEDLESLRHFVFKSGHASYLRRRREWFQKSEEAYHVLWWTPAGTIPTLADAGERLDRLRAHGSTPDAMSFNQTVPPPNDPTT
ncbi:MAG: DUF3291 domain-containing protein [Ilumatobacteraceae bacterium]